jgi:hypothetical protein
MVVEEKMGAYDILKIICDPEGDLVVDRLRAVCRV